MAINDEIKKASDVQLALFINAAIDEYKKRKGALSAWEVIVQAFGT